MAGGGRAGHYRSSGVEARWHMRELGRVVRLQVQVAPLKRGDKPHRWYDASRIRRVGEVTVTDHGVLGHLDGEPEPIVDVHHPDHPASRFRGGNGISLGVLGHYALMRDRFGGHVDDGVAGETVLIDHPGRLTLDDLAEGVTVLGTDRVVLAPVDIAEPCVEFSRFVLADAAGASLREPLRALRGGVRGFYLGVRAGEGARIREGDLVVSGTDA